MFDFSASRSPLVVFAVCFGLLLADALLIKSSDTVPYGDSAASLTNNVVLFGFSFLFPCINEKKKTISECLPFHLQVYFVGFFWPNDDLVHL